MHFFDFLGRKSQMYSFKAEDAHAWADMYFPSSHRSIASVIGGILVEQIDVSWDELLPSTRFSPELYIWDFDGGRYADAVEQRFGILIPENDREQLQRISDLVEYLYVRLRKPVI